MTSPCWIDEINSFVHLANICWVLQKYRDGQNKDPFSKIQILWEYGASWLTFRCCDFQDLHVGNAFVFLYVQVLGKLHYSNYCMCVSCETRKVVSSLFS